MDKTKKPSLRNTFVSSIAFLFNTNTKEFQSNSAFNCAMGYRQQYNKDRINFVITPRYFSEKTAKAWEMLCIDAGLPFRFLGTVGKFKKEVLNGKSEIKFIGKLTDIDKERFKQYLQHKCREYSDNVSKDLGAHFNNLYLIAECHLDYYNGSHFLAAHTAARYLYKPDWSQVVSIALKLYKQCGEDTKQALRCIYLGHLIVWKKRKYVGGDNKMLFAPNTILKVGEPKDFLNLIRKETGSFQSKLHESGFAHLSAEQKRAAIASGGNLTVNWINNLGPTKRSPTVLATKLTNHYKNLSYDKILDIYDTYIK